MGFSQALSGLNAASSNLNAVSNNIANSQTVGFKGSRVQFADVYAGAKVGLGVSVAGVMQNFKDGTLETTDRNLDLAIAGSGFFRFEQGGLITYSRNGQLTMTQDGYLVNAQGGRLTGFSAGAGGSGQPTPINVPSAGVAAQATGKGTGEKTGVQAVYNLDAQIDITDASLKSTVDLHAGLPKTEANKTESATYHYANTFTVYDSLGSTHNVTAYFEKTAANTWNVTTSIDGVKGVDNFTLEFGSDGSLLKNAQNEIIGVDGSDKTTLTFAATSFEPEGADALSFDFSLAGSTQFANDSTASSLVQDGYASGSLVGISIDESGQVIGSYSNEQTSTLGTIALANFRSPEGLKPAGGNGWVETGASGQPLIGTAGIGQFGSVEAGVVETSNVDLTQELVNLIIAQRNYQANAQSIKTQSDVLQQAVNLGV